MNHTCCFVPLLWVFVRATVLLGCRILCVNPTLQANLLVDLFSGLRLFGLDRFDFWKLVM